MKLIVYCSLPEYKIIKKLLDYLSQIAPGNILPWVLPLFRKVNFFRFKHEQTINAKYDLVVLSVNFLLS